MEVSTVPPPPASLTKGDNSCRINVTDVALHSVMLLICLCGTARNGAIVWLLRENPITINTFKQAFDDFLFLIFAILSILFFLLEDVSCSIIMPPVYLSFLFQLSLFSYKMGLFRLTFISIERCRHTLFPLCCSCQLPEGVLRVVMRALKWTFFYAVITLNPTVASLCQSQEHEHCRVALISMCALSLFLSAVPMVISSTILIVHVKCGPQQQQPEKADIVIFLTVLFALPVSICNFLQQFGYIALSSQVVFWLTCIHSTIKPFIYALVGSWRRPCSMESCWQHCSMKTQRTSLRRIFEVPEENTSHSNDGTMDTVL